MLAAKLILEVTVGLTPDMPIPERCRSWAYMSVDYEADKAEGGANRYHALCEEAIEYARQQMEPSSTNYVGLDWIWL